jgi:DNA-binding CsgD family transcriptional regulator
MNFCPGSSEFHLYFWPRCQIATTSCGHYITKPIDFDILETIINARLAGVARNRLADAARQEISPKLTNLNDREAELLTWGARGKTSAQIAEMLDITKWTVDFHLDNARVKLGASTRIEAAFKATMGGLIKP